MKAQYAYQRLTSYLLLNWNKKKKTNERDVDDVSGYKYDMTENPLGSLVTSVCHLHWLEAIDFMDTLSCRSCQCETSGINVSWEIVRNSPHFPSEAPLIKRIKSIAQWLHIYVLASALYDKESRKLFGHDSAWI